MAFQHNPFHPLKANQRGELMAKQGRGTSLAKAQPIKTQEVAQQLFVEIRPLVEASRSQVAQ